MRTNNTDIKKTIGNYLQYFALVAFTLFSIYFSFSYYRLYHMDSEELNELTGKVEAVRMKEGKGKQGKSEVWITMAETGQFRVAYGNTKTIKEVSNLIKKDDAITIYLKKAQNAFIDLGNDNDVLQLVKNGVIIYSLDIPQKNFQKYFMFSAIMSILLPLGCVFYWVKSRSNMMAALQNPTV
ncbi:MAG: hypothetical protein NVV82_00970 [Sporocytophaga sp.]|jgi:ATP-dependent Zn protease|nr:hypothetical protein [Sporocytophaga sp.]